MKRKRQAESSQDRKIRQHIKDTLEKVKLANQPDWCGSPAALKKIEKMEANNMESEKVMMPELLKDLAWQLGQLQQKHPAEYWEAALTMDLIPLLLPRKPARQKKWCDTLKKTGIIHSGKRGRFFDPDSPINKDVWEAYNPLELIRAQFQPDTTPETKKLYSLSFSMTGKETKEIAEKLEKLRSIPPVTPDKNLERLCSLDPLTPDNVAEWKPFILEAFMANHNGHPEKTAHAAENTRLRIKGRKSRPTDADVRNELRRDLAAALKILARDLARVRL